MTGSKAERPLRKKKIAGTRSLPKNASKSLELHVVDATRYRRARLTCFVSIYYYRSVTVESKVGYLAS